MGALSQRALDYQTPPILSRDTPENGGAQEALQGAEVARTVGSPSIERWLDDAGLNPFAFRLLGRISRRAGRHGASFESVPNMAAACAINERTVQRYLRILVASGFVQTKRPATPKTPAYYGVTSKIHLGDEQLLALFVPARLDDAQLSPQAFRLLYHYIARAYDGEIRANHSRAARTCGISRPKVMDFEAELVKAGLLEFTEKRSGQSVFRITCLPESDLEAQLSISDTPTVNLRHPYLSTETPKLSISDTPGVNLRHPRCKPETPKGFLLRSPLKEEAGGGEKFEEEPLLPSSDPGTTTLHQTEEPQEGKTQPSSDTHTATPRPPENPQASDAVRSFINLTSFDFVRRVRRTRGEYADNTLEGWLKEHGCEFVTKAWQVAHDPTHRVEGKAAMWVFEDYLTRSRDLPGPLLRIKEEAKKEEAAKRAAKLFETDLEDGDLFEWSGDGQTYQVFGEPEKGFVLGIEPGGDVLDRRTFRVSECKSLRFDLENGDLFQWCGAPERTYTVHGRPGNGFVVGLLPGQSPLLGEAFRVRECRLTKRAEQVEAEAGQVESAPPAPEKSPEAPTLSLKDKMRATQAELDRQARAHEERAKDPEYLRALEARRKKQIAEFERWVAETGYSSSAPAAPQPA
jgi:hypothetical protein